MSQTVQQREDGIFAGGMAIFLLVVCPIAMAIGFQFDKVHEEEVRETTVISDEQSPQETSSEYRCFRFSTNTPGNRWSHADIRQVLRRSGYSVDIDDIRSPGSFGCGDAHGVRLRPNA